ncbi:MAG: ATP-binding protein [Dehalococcoidia bacterium]
MQHPKAWIAWSSGKDSAWALHVIQQSGDVEIVGLLTTISEAFGRVSMHGVRETLLDAQAEALRLPLHRVSIPTPCTDEVYDAAMRTALERARADGVTQVVFGDVSLRDVRAYREARLREVGMVARFPLWMRDTASLAQEMIGGGLRAFLTCIDPRKVPREMAGRAYDETLLASLPECIDPCGENGEFHTFVWDGPMFTRPIDVRLGETVERDGFLFSDLLPADRHRQER